MALKIFPMSYGRLTMDASGLVLFRTPGTKTTIPFLGFLITGGQEPVLVDTGARATQDFAAFGMDFVRTPEMTIDHQLARHGLRRGDIRYVVHTHAHIDHAGGDDQFPMSTTVALARRELEFAASGIMGSVMYTAEDTKHLIDRLHTRNALRLFDVDGTFEEEVIPGVAVRLSGGHTPGSLSILVETDEGIANLAGDIAYHVDDQLVSPLLDHGAHEPTISANRAMTSLEEKKAIKRALSDSRFLLVGHDDPALVSGGRIVGRYAGATDNPRADVTAAANYAPLRSTSLQAA
ncbi:N-acyl homoserine lactonase family protein [Geminicoccus roseus]|uniref:N-acyl homoserine lactonase family protein n=1 Tax=Geminicoccus roseus TaxID=404900 RepID=UPI0004007A35|nr:N-acyl homoserine lactonase family protein [Geminicoccus roseus]